MIFSIRSLYAFCNFYGDKKKNGEKQRIERGEGVEGGLIADRVVLF